MPVAQIARKQILYPESDIIMGTCDTRRVILGVILRVVLDASSDMTCGIKCQ